MDIMTEHITIAKYPAYKHSGTDWLGEIPEHWETIKMKYLFRDVSVKNRPDAELLSVTQDKGVVPRTWVENRMVMPNGGLGSFKFIEEGDFAISLRSFEGGLEYCYHDGIISPAYTVLKSQRKFDNRYYRFLFKSQSFISELQTSVVGIREGKNISYGELCHSQIPIPSPEEQAAIADFLDRRTEQIDRAIGQKEKQIELLKERRQILIHHAVTRGLNPNIPLKDSGIEWIGQIPEHWEVKRLKYVLNSQGRIGFKGYTITDLVDEGEGALTFGASHIDWDGNFILDEPVYISWKKYYESPEIMVSKGDILIVQRGSTCGKVAYVRNDFGPLTINPSLVLLKHINENPEYVFLGIKVVLSGILNIINKTAIPMLSQFQIDNIKIVVPPKAEQSIIIEHVNSIANKVDESINCKLQEIDKLKEYKNVLMNEAVTGKIKVV